MNPALPAQLDWVVRFRGVAALWVLTYHVWFSSGGEALRFGLPFDFTFGLRSFMRAGYMGIDLFFVLSGFVVAWPYVRRGVTHVSLPEAVDFYQRRYFRIAPVYYVSIAVAVGLTALGWFVKPIDTSAVILHVLFAQNFDENASIAIRGVYWTLPTEISFYLVFPLLLRWVDPRRPWKFMLGALAFALAYRTFVWWMITREGVWLTWTHAYLPGRIDQFAFGMGAAWGVAIGVQRGWRVSGRMVIASLLLAVVTAMAVARHPLVSYGWMFFFGASLVGAAIATMLLAMGIYFCTTPARPREFPGAGALYQVGLASLSLYIWHTFFIDLAVHFADLWGWSRGARIWLVLGAIPASLALSFLTYRVIEKPFIDFSKSDRMRGRLKRWDARRRANLATLTT